MVDYHSAIIYNCFFAISHRNKKGWNAEEQSSGIYFYKLNTDDYSKTKKMILLK